VVHFFVSHPDLDTSQVGPIVDYLYHQRFVPQEVCLEESELINLGPPQPNLSMKGRTPRSLSRQVAEWQRGLGRWPRMPTLWWPRCGIGEFRLAEPGIVGKDERVWTIRELHSSRQLRVEGKAMHHCVADYVRLCLKKRSSIWSMEVEDQEGRQRVLTIEVDPATREVVQASRRRNMRPTPEDQEILGRWAHQEGLKVEC
jgi:hypothetical protein